MSTRRFHHLFIIVRALLVAVLCGALAGSVLADGKDAKRSDDSRRGDRPKQEAKQESTRGAKDGKDSRQDSSPTYHQPNAKWSGRSDSKDKTWPSYTPKGSSGPKDSYRPKDSYHPGYKPSDRTYRPSRTYDYKPDRYDSHYSYRPRTYTPPTRYGGYYNYSPRPSSKTCHYSHWVFDGKDSRYSRRSVYFRYGSLGYLSVARIHIAPYLTVEYRSTPIHIRDGYYLSQRGSSDLEDALSDIRRAWVDQRLDLLKGRVDTDSRIAVLLDGRYDYSIDGRDYLEMTADAIDEVTTISFTWEGVRERTDGDYTAYGKHVFRDDSALTQTVYVSYTLRKIAGEYEMVEVGSSSSPLL